MIQRETTGGNLARIKQSDILDLSYEANAHEIIYLLEKLGVITFSEILDDLAEKIEVIEDEMNENKKTV